MDGKAWHTSVHRVSKSRTWLSDWTELNWTECQFMTIFETVQKEDIESLSPLFLITEPWLQILALCKPLESSLGQEWWGHSSWVSSLLCLPLCWLRTKSTFLFPPNSVSVFFCIWLQWSERTKILGSTMFLPGKFHGQRSLVDYIPQGHKKSNTAEHSRLQSETESHSVMSDSLQPRGLYNLWNSPGQNTGVGSLSLLQGIFPTQGFYPGLPHCRQILYQPSHKRSTHAFKHSTDPNQDRGSDKNCTGKSRIH